METYFNLPIPEKVYITILIDQWSHGRDIIHISIMK